MSWTGKKNIRKARLQQADRPKVGKRGRKRGKWSNNKFISSRFQLTCPMVFITISAKSISVLRFWNYYDINKVNTIFIEIFFNIPPKQNFHHTLMSFHNNVGNSYRITILILTTLNIFSDIFFYSSILNYCIFGKIFQ